jgi:hypothetical protein
MRRGAATGLLVAWIAGLAAMALWFRPIAEALRERGVLTLAVSAALTGAGLLVLRLLRRDGDDGRPLVPWVPLVLTLAAAAWLATWWRLPEERIHVAQYLPLGVIAWRALGGRPLPAALLAIGLGLGDEALQGLLPDRTFDGWDVAANAIASGAGVLLAHGGRTAWGAVALLVAARLLLPALHPGHPGIPPGGGDDPAVEAAPTPDGVTLFEPGAAAGPVVVDTDPTAPYADASVLLVTVDALRADHVRPWGEASVPTPAFDRLADTSVSWQQVRAASTWTTPSIVALLTGLAPAVHGVAGRGLELAPSIATPLDALQLAGWRTVGFAGDATETYRHLGFDEELDPEIDPVEQVVEALGAPGRSFVWLHLRQIHAPYDATPDRLAELGLSAELPAAPILDRARSHYTVPRAGFPGRHDWLVEPLRALYAAELADADAALGGLLDGLDAAGLAGRVVVVVTADHGEELLDHDGIGHASTTLDSAPQPELVEIPLWLRLPDGRAAGRVVPATFDQVDLMPTLAPLIGIGLPAPAPGVARDGRDQSGPLRSPEAPSPPEAPALITGSPCGWQCPAERRDERVHAWIDRGAWSWHRDGGPPPEPALAQALAEADARRRALRTPVPSPR